MFNLIVTASLRNRVFVLAASLLLIGLGGWLIPKLNIDVLPDLNRPTVTIQAESHGLAAEEVEQLVTFPIESAMQGLPGVTRVRSTSSLGLAFIYVEFEWGSEIYRARQQVAERLAAVQGQLPEEIRPAIGPITSVMGEIMLVAVAGEKADPMELREVAEFSIRPRLLAIPGVAQVIPIGGLVREYRVAPDPARMRQLGVTLDEIEATVRGFSTNAGGGFIDERAQEFVIRTLGRERDPAALAGLVVATRDGTPILLGAVADVGYAARPRRGSAGFGGQPAVILGVQKQPGVDTLSLTREIETALEAMRATLPPQITTLQVQFRQASFIENSIGNVQKVLIEALLIVGVVLFLFLMNVRTTFISLVAIPMSVFVTAIVFRLFDLSINTMTLGGLAIAIGELVDDAVVGVENIFRRLRENRALPQPRPLLGVVAEASQEVRSGIFYATIIIVLVFVPLFALTGIEGQLFAPLGVAYIVSILASLLVSITLTPVLCYYLLPSLPSLEEPESRLVRGLKAGYSRLLDWTLPRRAPVLGIAALAVVLALAGAWRLPKSFLPAFNEGTSLVTLVFTPGIAMADSERLGTIAERLIGEVPEVVSVGRRTGRAELDEHAEGVHMNEIDINLEPSDRGRQAVLADIRSRLAPLPGSVSFGQPISHRLDHLLSGVQAQLVVKIWGDDLDTLRSLGAQVEQRLAGTPGLVDLRLERQVRAPEIHVRVDEDAARFYGITPARIAERIDLLSGGERVAEVIDGSRRYGVTIQLPEEARTKAGLAGVLIETARGAVPLAHLASVEEADGPNQVQREDGRRRIVVSGNTDGTGADRVVAEMERRLVSLPLPTGYTLRIEGQFRAQQEAARMIGLLSLVSLTLIFLVLYTRYRSAALALIVMGNVPLALVGSVAALWIAGLDLSIAAMVGFITLTGITARNGILKISHTLNLVLRDGLPFDRATIRRACLERMTPVLMTAVSAGIALVPLMIGGDQPGKEILHPVAVTIFGGLFTATLLDAVVTPTLIERFGAAAIARLREERAVAGVPAEAY
ncbi:MAG: efflux RND transporter permease subunit [Gammaproteobacteria bacterium]|nr:efflux RND transporter permease subunit [Gammaproteobacteria bacterium]